MQNVGEAPSHIRTYSLTNSSNRKYFVISVKLEKSQQLTINQKLVNTPGIIYLTSLIRMMLLLVKNP